MYIDNIQIIRVSCRLITCHRPARPRAEAVAARELDHVRDGLEADRALRCLELLAAATATWHMSHTKQ